MKSRMSLTMLAGLAAVVVPASLSRAEINLVGLEGPYRVLFVTSTVPTGPATMAALNPWVTSLAVASGLDAAATTENGGVSPGWNVFGATSTVDVLTNTGLALTGGVPVYFADGTLFATDYDNFWDASAHASDNPMHNESGVDPGGNGWGPGNWTHTGLSATPGVTDTGFELDAAKVRMGGQTDYATWYGGNGNWGGSLGGAANGGSGQGGSLFAISGVIGDEAVAAADLEITEIDYAPDTGSLTLTWNSSPNETYRVDLSTDLIDWDFELDDSLPAAADETTTTATFNLNDDFPEGIPESAYFRVEKN